MEMINLLQNIFAILAMIGAGLLVIAVLIKPGNPE